MESSFCNHVSQTVYRIYTNYLAGLVSTNKCNKTVIEDLVRSPEVKDFARAVVKTVGDELNVRHDE